MRKVIAFANQKGGCSKTTSCSNIAAALSEMGKKVLVIDLDSQGSLSSAFNYEEDDIEKTMLTLVNLRNRLSWEHIQKVILKTKYKNLFIIPADVTLSDLEEMLYKRANRFTVFKEIIDAIEGDFDYILLDLPPALGIVSLNALCASDYVIIPILPVYFTIKGTKYLYDTINHVKQLNSKLQIMGFLITNHDERKKNYKNNIDAIRAVFQDKVFSTYIRTDSQVENSQEAGMPVVFYNSRAKATKDYINVAKEVLYYE